MPQITDVSLIILARVLQSRSAKLLPLRVRVHESLERVSKAVYEVITIDEEAG